MVLRDPIGYYAAILRDNFTFPANAWRDALSDAKGTSIHQGFKRVNAGMDWRKILVSEVDKSVLRTVDPSSLTGSREIYQTANIAAAGSTLGDPPAIVFFMPFELRPELFGVERSVDIA